MANDRAVQDLEVINGSSPPGLLNGDEAINGSGSAAVQEREVVNGRAVQRNWLYASWRWRLMIFITLAMLGLYVAGTIPARERNHSCSLLASNPGSLSSTCSLLEAARKVRERGAAINFGADIGPFSLHKARFRLSEVYVLQALLIFLAVVLWPLLFVAKDCRRRYLSSLDSRSLSRTLLSSQALEHILVASGDVEENPGPTYLADEELTAICNHRLVVADARDILKAISPVAARYSAFLRFLGLPEDELSRINTKCRGDPEECLREGIVSLLKENYNTVKYGSLTWRRLVEAVADTTGGNDHSLARKTAAEHQELHNCSVNRDRECLRLATTSASPSTRHMQQKYKHSGSFAKNFPELKEELGRCLEPDKLKEFLNYFSDPASPEHCLVEKKVYHDLDSTSQILSSLYPTYINPGNMLLLQEIVDKLGSEKSKTLLRTMSCNYNRQWEWHFCHIFILIGAALFFVYFLLNFNLFSFICT